MIPKHAKVIVRHFQQRPILYFSQFTETWSN